MAQVIYGIHAVSARLNQSDPGITRLLVLSGRSDAKLQQILDMAKTLRLKPESVDRKTLDSLAQGENHQGVLAYVEQAEQVWGEGDLPEILAKMRSPGLILILDGVTDPHNLGACLRSADAAGVGVVIAPKDRAASLTPVARKIACGAAESIPFVQVTNLARTLDELKDAGFWSVGLAGETDQSLYDIDMTGNTIIVMGAEGEGMRRLTKERCDFLAKIPMLGQVESLNVSVATGVALFEVLRQRKYQK